MQRVFYKPDQTIHAACILQTRLSNFIKFHASWSANDKKFKVVIVTSHENDYDIFHFEEFWEFNELKKNMKINKIYIKIYIISRQN